jgi:hypothetical protein
MVCRVVYYVVVDRNGWGGLGICVVEFVGVTGMNVLVYMVSDGIL